MRKKQDQPNRTKIGLSVVQIGKEALGTQIDKLKGWSYLDN